MNEHTLPDPGTDQAARAQTPPTAAPTALPAPADLIAALPVLLQPADVGTPFVVVYTSNGSMLGPRRHPSLEEADDLRAVAHHLDEVLDYAEGQDACLIAYVGPASVPVLQEIAAAGHPGLQAVLRVHDGHWWRHTGPADAQAANPAGTPVLTDPDAVANAVNAVRNARYASGFAHHLQLGPPHVRVQVREHLTALAGAGGEDPRLSTQELFALLSHERAARSSGSLPLDPGQAAPLLFALTHPMIWEHAVAWADDGARYLWHDLLHCAPTGWIRPAATLSATTALQQDRPQEACSAAAHALADLPEPGREQHIGEVDLAEAVLALAPRDLHGGRLHDFILGYRWATSPHHVLHLLDDEPAPPA
jgi:hypothetical protein